MSAMVVAAAGFCGLVLATLGLSLIAVLRARSVAEGALRESRRLREEQSAAIQALEQRIEAFAARIEEARVVSHTVAVSPERGGLNLNRRSQALRLHRRGESPTQIAAELRVPLQEVLLLIKVHEIVMSTI